MGRLLLPSADSALNLLPRLTRSTRRAWAQLGRPVTLPESSDQWRHVLEAMRPIQGPFDWALCMGPIRWRPGSRLTPIGNLIEAWQAHDHADSRSALARLARELLNRAQDELAFDFRSELPNGFESGRPLCFADLVPEHPGHRPDFWIRRLASSFEGMPAHPELAHLALDTVEPVVRKRVLLTTVVFDRPELASACVHLLKSRGALWVGLLALADDTRPA